MDIWFDDTPDAQGRRGTTLFSVAPDGLWAVIRAARTYPDDLAAEARNLLGVYGGMPSGVGAQLLDDGVELPQGALREWAEHPDRPAAEVGRWRPALISFNGSALLALATDLDRHTRVTAATVDNEHIVILTPPTGSPISVSARVLPATPPAGWDQGGGRV